MRFGLIIKILILVITFGVVLYGIRALKSPSVQTSAGDPNSIVGLLIGGDQRLLNWCPPDVQKVEIYDHSGSVVRILTSAQDISAVCELMIGGFSQGAQTPQFKVKLQSYSKSSEAPVALEAAEGAPLFRVKGMPFSSPGLVKALERFEAK